VYPISCANPAREYRRLVVMVIAVGVEVVYQAETKDDKLRDRGGKKGPCPALSVSQAVVQRLMEKTGFEDPTMVPLGVWAAL
jgi:hypothetical protein